MKTLRRCPIVLSLIAILIAAGLVACMGGDPLKRGAAKQAAQLAKPQQASQAVATGPEINLAQNLKLLDQVEDYYGIGHRGPYSDGGGGRVILPLEDRMEQGIVERLLDSRRVLLVLQGLSRLPKQEAAQLVSQEIQVTLPAYTKAFDAEIEKLIRIRAEQKIELAPGQAISGIGIQASNNKDGSPTMVGLRMKLLALCLIAGNLELRPARPAMIELVRVAQSQRALIYDESRLKFDFDRMEVAHVLALYIKVILATGLAGTAPDGMRSGTKAGDWVQKKFPLDDSGLPASYRPDFPAGAQPTASGNPSLSVLIHRPLSDTEFDRFLPGPGNGDTAIEPLQGS